MTEFERRQIGRTSLRVTEEIVNAAWAAGVRYVDTAPFDGVGQAERCVGDALRDRSRSE
jgi:D-threo-aldose 1-dehydrogenase